MSIMLNNDLNINVTQIYMALESFMLTKAEYFLQCHMILQKSF